MSSTKRFWPLIFILVPFAALLYGIINFAVDMPFADAWAMVPYLQRSYDGTLTFRHLLEQHNESRIFFPRLLMIGLARLTGWNTFYEIAAIVVTAVLTLALLAIQGIRTSTACLGKTHAWMPVLFSLLIFSVLQYECWTFGFTLVGYMNILFVVAGFFLLASEPLSTISFAAALAAGTVATYSYANGIFFWPVGLLMILMLARERRHQNSEMLPHKQRALKIWLCALWILFAAGVLGLYFTGYRTPGLHPALSFFLDYPLIFSSYLLAFLGGAIVNIPGFPISAPVTIGAIGMLIFAVCAANWFYLSPRGLKSLSPWLALAVYVLLTGLAAALGRSAYGIRQALDSRYTMFSGLFWISTLVMAFNIVGYIKPASRMRRIACLCLKIAGPLFLAVCLALFLLSSFHAMKAWKQRYTRMRAIRNELLSFQPDQALLAETFPVVAYLMNCADWLTQSRLSLFPEKKTFQDYRLSKAPAGHIESVECDLLPDKVFADGKFRLSGRAYDPRHGHYKAVLLVNSNLLIFARADVTPDSRGSWSLTLNATKLPVGKSAIDLYALFQDGTHIARIGELNLETIPASDMKTTFRITRFIENPDATAGFIDIFYIDGDLVRGSGWARDPATDQPAKWVVVVNQETNILTYARITDERKDVADNLQNKDLLRCGWRAAFDTELLRPGRHVLRAYMFLPDENKAVRLRNEFDLTLP